MSKPLSANDQAVKTLADDLWKEMLSHSPIWGTFLGIEVDDGALDDTSDAARLRDRAMWEKYSKAAKASTCSQTARLPAGVAREAEMALSVGFNNVARMAPALGSTRAAYT
ncbi:MAG: hypothetical protein ACKOPF_04845, partial [Candidatus Limnocylindrus sp.]